MLQGSKSTIVKARSLRRGMSLPEVLLWQALRTRPGGLRCRRQHPAGPYVLDFYCPLRTLAIEIDGEAHDRGDRPRRDERRDAWLASRGIGVLRIPAAEVLADLDAVIRLIVGAASRRPPLHHAAHGSPPLAGEELS